MYHRYRKNVVVHYRGTDEGMYIIITKIRYIHYHVVWHMLNIQFQTNCNILLTFDIFQHYSILFDFSKMFNIWQYSTLLDIIRHYLTIEMMVKCCNHWKMLRSVHFLVGGAMKGQDMDNSITKYKYIHIHNKGYEI